MYGCIGFCEVQIATQRTRIYLRVRFLLQVISSSQFLCVLLDTYNINHVALLGIAMAAFHTKLHAGTKWPIFHILPSEDLGDIISSFNTIVCADSRFVYITKRKYLRGLVDICVQMRVCKHVMTFQIRTYFWEIFYKSNRVLFPCLYIAWSKHSGLGRLGKFSKVMQTLHCIPHLHNWLKFSESPSCLVEVR